MHHHAIALELLISLNFEKPMLFTACNIVQELAPPFRQAKVCRDVLMRLDRVPSGDEESLLGRGCVASKLAPLHWDVVGRAHVASNAQAYGFPRVLTIAPCRLGGTSTRPNLQELVESTLEWVHFAF